MADPLPIVKYPDPFLRRKAEAVVEITEEIRAKADRMIETMVAARGIGLAATQVGWGVRLAVVSDNGEPEDSIVVVNPTIEEVWGSAAMEEGCLSFPGVTANITRARGVRVSYTGLDGERYEIDDEDLLGRCILHEIDHLDGVTFLSKMSPADKLANRRALRRLEERAERLPA